MGGATTLSSTLAVSGPTTLSSTLAVTGATTLSSTTRSVGNFDVNTNKFTVNAANGNTGVAGTLDVSGTTTLATVSSGTWQGTCIANAYVCDSTTWIDTGGTGLTKTGTSLNVDASQTQITQVGTINSGTWQGSKIQDNYIQSAGTWNSKVGTGGTGLTKSGTTLNVDASQTQITQVGTINSGTWQASK